MPLKIRKQPNKNVYRVYKGKGAGASIPQKEALNPLYIKNDYDKLILELQEKLNNSVTTQQCQNAVHQVRNELENRPYFKYLTEDDRNVVHNYIKIMISNRVGQIKLKNT